MGQVRKFWGLTTEPFTPRNPPFVATAVHTEAVARVLHTIDSGDSRLSLRGAEGLGKTVVLKRLAENLQSQGNRVVRVAGGDDLPAAILDELLAGRSKVSQAGGAWNALIAAARVLRFQKKTLIILIDDSDHLAIEQRPMLSRLTHLDSHPDSNICVLDAAPDEPRFLGEPWSLSIRLRPLTRSETARYLADKIAIAGRSQPVFTDRAITRLHALSSGVPRGLDRLAALALLVGAARGLEILPPEVIDGVAGECIGPVAA